MSAQNIEMAKLAINALSKKERLAILADFSPVKAAGAVESVKARIIRRADVAGRFSVSLRTIDGWASSGFLRRVKLPGHVRASGFRESDVVALIGAGE